MVLSNAQVGLPRVSELAQGEQGRKEVSSQKNGTLTQQSGKFIRGARCEG